MAVDTSRFGTVDDLGGKHAIRFERRVDHPVEKVWAAISHPDGIADWLGPAEIDLRVGGSLHITFDRTVGNIVVGEFREVETERVLEYTFGEPDSDDVSVVRWELEPDGDGTILRLSHTIDDPEFVDKALAGWHDRLDALEAALDGNPVDWDMEKWEDLQRRYVERLA
jgi:uncharacterized protein YndB with AHSA1/START domain